MKQKRFILIISTIFLSAFVITTFLFCTHRKPQLKNSFPADSALTDIQKTESPLEEMFENPPNEAKPWVMWWWEDENVTKEGITADLEAMAANGIAGVYLFTISRNNERLTIVEKTAIPLTDYWWELIKYTAKEADRLGLKIALNACDGWATAAAPEITPELSMQELVWSNTKVLSGNTFDGMLEKPITRLGYYRDLAVWAIPLPVENPVSSDELEPVITTDITGVDVSQLKKPDGSIISGQSGWIQYSFKRPLTCRSVTIYGIPDNLYNAFNCQLEVSADSINWGNSIKLKPPLLGGLQNDLSISYSIKPTTGRYFRFTFNNENFDPKTWKMKFSTGWLPGYYQPVLGISKIIINENPVIEGWQHKNGSLWRQSRSFNSENILESLCVKIADMINLTDKMQPDGSLKWEAPKGNTWLLQRFGYTTTGSRNGPANIRAQGLEADKFNSASVDIQYSSWLGKANSILQKEGKGKVLITNHIDSWECRSQNWSPVFRDEFTKRRGYDPVKYLPAMTGIPVESAEVSERFLNDIRITISELICNNFLDPYVKLVHKNGARFSVEATAPVQVADGMAHFGKADLPLGEFWLQSPLHDKPNDIMDAVHAARIYGKNIIGAEAFTQLANKWNEDPFLLKTIGDFNYANGINFFILNAYPHKATNGEPGITFWGGLGTEFSRTQPWWKASKAWFDYITRTQALLQKGNPVVDVLYYTGENMPVRAFMPDDLAPELPEGYTYNSINRDALLNQTGTENSHIVLPGGITCRVLVLPADSRMSPEVAEKIAQMLHDGVIVIGAKPDRSWSLSGYPQCDKEVQRIVRKGWKDVRGNITPKKVFEEIDLQPDVVFDNTDLSFIWKEEQQYKTQTFVWSHRITKNADIYFLSNQEYKWREVVVKFRVTGKVPELWNAETGKIRELPNYSVNNGQTSIPLKFGPAESYFIVFRKDGIPKKISESNFPEYTDIMTIESPWKIYFQKQRGVPESIEMKELISLHLCSEQGVKYFSGTATYKNTFHLKNSRQSRIFIDLGEVANIADIYLNGKEVATLWKPPFRVELTGLLNSGDNVLEIHVSNTWRNRLVGDVNKPQNEKVTYLPDFPVQRLRELSLINSGLLGPVKIQEIK